MPRSSSPTSPGASTPRTRRGARPHRGLPAQRARAPAVALHGPAAHLRLRRLDRVGPRAVAADRPGRRRGPQARVVKRLARHRVDGVLLFDKPAGLSSNAALQRVRRLYAAEKAGHTGTLDPLATGLLPIALGEATKFAHALLDAPKRYLATIRLGSETATGDAEGEVVRTLPVAVDRAGFAALLPRFLGRQLPDAAPARCAEASRASVLRVDARGRRGAAASPRDRDHLARPRRLATAGCHRRRRVQQGHLHPRARRGSRRGGGHLCAPRGAAPHGDRRVHGRRRGDARRARGDGRGRPPVAARAGRRAGDAAWPGSTWTPPPPRAFGMASRFRSKERTTAVASSTRAASCSGSPSCAPASRTPRGSSPRRRRRR